MQCTDHARHLMINLALGPTLWRADRTHRKWHSAHALPDVVLLPAQHDSTCPQYIISALLSVLTQKLLFSHCRMLLILLNELLQY